MKISYNWLKLYIPEVPKAEKLRDIFTYHLCEVENVEEKEGDFIFDINILPNRAHDLLSHQGIARELASLLDIPFVDPTPKYKIPESKPTNLKIEIKTDKCRRYMGRIIRNVKVGPSPDWVVQHLESIGQRSINNIVDAANITMFDCGQPIHAFDFDKISKFILVREAKEGETMTTLDNKKVAFNPSNMVIADEKNVLAIAGVKGGKIAEVDENTRNIVVEMANFDPVSVRKTAKQLGIFTDAVKRFENDLSSELAFYAMREFSALVLEMCPESIFEDIVDVYPQKQVEHRLSFSADRISKILGLKISDEEVEKILKRFRFEYKKSPHDKGDLEGLFEIIVPPLRLDLTIEEDMAEEIGRILGYDKIKSKIPKINFKPKVNETYAKINWARNKLLSDGYSEVMTYAFRDKGEVEVLASASDKKFLRTNLADGLLESVSDNLHMLPLLGIKSFKDLKIFEVGTIWFPKEEIHVAYNNEEAIIEKSLDEFCKDMPTNFSLEPSPIEPKDSVGNNLETKFKMWSIYPFISRDVAVWMPEGESSEKLKKILKENGTKLLIQEPYLFDSFTKDGKTSYAFRLVFQSYERTLTDTEINEIMAKITDKIKENKDWQVR